MATKTVQPAVTKDEVLQSMEQEAQELEQEEKSIVAEQDAISARLFDAAKEVTDKIDACNKVIETATADHKAAIEKADADHKTAIEEANSKHITTVEATKTEREALKNKFQNALDKMQSAFGVAPKILAIPRKVKVQKVQKVQVRASNDKTIGSMITDYLGKKGQARTSEIRIFLEGQGRMTNPGVALSRLVRDGILVNKERGLYALGRNHK